MGMLSTSPRQIFNDWEDNGLPAGEHHLGQVGIDLVVSSVSVFLTVGATYTSGDLAGTGGLLTFANAARVAGGKGCVRGAMFVDRGDQKAEFNLILFNTTTISTTLTDDSAFTVDDRDVATVVGVITCASINYVDFTDNVAMWRGDQDIYFDLPDGATSLYGAVRVAASWTASTSSDLGIQLQIERF